MDYTPKERDNLDKQWLWLNRYLEAHSGYSEYTVEECQRVLRALEAELQDIDQETLQSGKD